MSSRFEIKQSEEGYRFSLDPFLLADFITAKRAERIIDFGTGNGILVVLLGAAYPDACFIGLDIQHEPLTYAKKNCARRLNAAFIQGDIRNCKSLIKPGGFDLAVSNPPYRKAESGRINPAREKAISRHEIAVNLEELIAAAFHALKDGGTFYLVHLAERSAEALHLLKKERLEPKTVRFVHSKEGEDAFLVMIGAVKKGKNAVTVMPPITVYAKNGGYSEEMRRIYERFE